MTSGTIPKTHLEIDSGRLRALAAADPTLAELVRRMLRVSIGGLPEMLRSDEKTFAYTRILDEAGGTRLRGTSHRYGAIVLLGARWLDESTQRSILDGESASEFCERLIDQTRASSNLGDVALVAWAAGELGHSRAGEAIGRLIQMAEGRTNGFTVELAWALSALAARPDERDASEMARSLRTRLMTTFSPEAGVFSHTFGAGSGGGMRIHVACFADQVYPIQALSRWHRVAGDETALSAADRCAQQITRLQGNDGQWWWHYDARTGSVLEGYPVYSVHQDAMGPMALLDLAEAGGADHSEAIRRSLQWMARAAEVGHTLIDDDRGLIWRKVGRTDPGKLVRKIRATTSRIHPSLRLGILDAVFPTSRIDRESRPYHLGWVIHTWLGHL